MPEVDRSPCRVCGSGVELLKVSSAAGVPPVRVCTSLLCPSNLADLAEREIAAV